MFVKLPYHFTLRCAGNGFTLSVQVQRQLTLVASGSSSENLVPAFRAKIAFLFLLNPFFSAVGPPERDRSQDHLFTHSHGKIPDMFAGKFFTLMAAFNSSGFGAIPDLAVLAMHKSLIRQAAPAVDILGGHTLAARQRPFSGYPSAVKANQALLELLIVVLICQIDGADPAIQAAGRYEIRIITHHISSFISINGAPRPHVGDDKPLWGKTGGYDCL